MNNQEQHSAFKKWSIRFFWLCAAVFVLGWALRLSLKTTFVKNKVLDIVINTANEQLNGTLSIDRLTGDLWEEISLSGIALQQQDTTVNIDSIHVKYNIWNLVGRQIEISHFHIYQPKVHLHQNEDGWNVQNLMTESTVPDTVETEMISFQIDNLVLQDGAVSIRSDSLPAGSEFAISELHLASSLGYGDDGYRIALKELAFRIDNDVSSQPITVQAGATLQQKKLSLEQLVIAAGHSLIRASGRVNAVDSTLQVDVSANPIGWQDAVEYISDYPVRQDLDITLNLKGKPEQFNLSLDLSGKGLRNINLKSKFTWQSDLIIRQLHISGDEVDLASALGDTAYPRFKNINAYFDGEIHGFDSHKSTGNFNLSLTKIAVNHYKLEQLTMQGTLVNGNAELNAEAGYGQQKIGAEVSARHIWSERPLLQGQITASNINPGFWIQDTTFNGNLTFRTEFSGSGWYPQKEAWNYGLWMNRGSLMGHTVTDLNINGRVNKDDFSTEGSFNIEGGTVDMTASVQQYSGKPSYTYQLETKELDIGMLIDQQDFYTEINSTISGRGRGIDPSDLQLKTELMVNPSVINGETIRKLSVNLSVDDGVAVVDSAQLEGTIADGFFHGRSNLLDFYDLNNELLLDVELKDLSALAPLAGIDSLQATGTLTGMLRPSENKELGFWGTLNLRNIVFDSMFSSDGIQGSIDIKIGEQLRYLVNLDLDSPSFSGMQFQRINVITNGAFAERLFEGEFDFRFSSPNVGRIEHAGSYYLREDSARVQTKEFNIISDYRTLTLEHPFELYYQDGTLQMDTMRVSSGDGAFLQMGLPMLSASEQHGFVKGQSLNMAVIQNSLFGDSFIKGMLSGEFEIARKDTILKTRGEVLLTELTVDKAKFDSLQVTAQIEDERLNGQLLLMDESIPVAVGDADLPFKLGNPEQFPQSFFKEPVRGELRLHDISIERFQSLFDSEGVTQTTGLLSFWGTLSGTAGNPEFDADVSLKNATLSGVTLDSLVAGVNYHHEDKQLRLDGSVLSLRQRAAQISARFPLFIDFKTFQVTWPQKNDQIDVDIETNNFNLRALNDFLNPLLVRDVNGQLDGRVQINGTMGDPRPEGYLELKSGSFRLIPANIKVDNISTQLDIAPNRIQLLDFTAQSGNGTLNAGGIVALDKLVPGTLDIEINGQNFRAANTEEYNAVINTKLEIGGSVTNPELSGSIDFESGFLELDNFGEKSVETVRLDNEEEVVPSVSVYDSLSLDMDIGFNRRFFIQNERYLEMEVELDGELDLVKRSDEDLQLFGTMNAASGFARPFGKDFDIEEGVLTFSGDPENPKLKIQTRYEPPQTQEDIVIWYIIEGTVEDPKFRYESQPPMELENIISYTLFGRPFYALDSWKQVVARSGSNTTASDVALDVLLDRVENLATQQLGIDIVKIDNTRSGGEAGTSITTGWYLNPKVFFSIQNVITGSTPDTGFLLEYMLREDLKLILRQGYNTRQGVDLKWNYDY